MPTWYYSPFPEEYNKFSTLYFCEFCLSFFGYTHELDRHLSRCTLRHPPGNEIYRSQEKNVNISVFEVDGCKEITYTQNLCYIAKLFLDHKVALSLLNHLYSLTLSYNRWHVDLWTDIGV
jgi:hypothetical protein